MEKKNEKDNLKGYGFIVAIFVIVIALILIISKVNNTFIDNIFSNSSSKEANKITVSFEKEDYSCDAGDSFETVISTNGTNIHDSLKSYRTTDEEIATIDTNTTYIVKCLNCMAVRVVCKKAGNIKLVAESVSGAINTANLTVASKEGTISFDKTNYSCEEGTTFETKITAFSNSQPSTVKSYSTSDSSIATIDDKTQYAVKCVNCKMVRVVCKKTGNVKLIAESSTGAKTTSNLEVIENKGTISYSNTNYSCTVGTSFETMIKTSGSTLPSTISSYSTSDSEIATIDDKTSVQVNCVNCRMVRVVCKKAGNVKLYAKSSTGATTTSQLEVKEDKGTIAYSEKSYTCEAGTSFETMIKASGGTTPATIKSYSTSDINVATIDDNTSVQVNCVNCRMVRVVCKKAGDIKLYAESSTGQVATSTLKVTENKGTISFDQNSYSCYAGDVFETVITANGGPLSNTVKSFSSSDTSIATMDTNTSYQLKCPNCKVVRVLCKKVGNTKLNAVSSTGAKVSVNLTVSQAPETISFAESNYTCEAGTSFETMISVNSGGLPGTIKSYSTSDSTIATIDNNTSVQVNCYNCRIVRVVCKKNGNVKLYAESTNGATTTSNLTVKDAISSISFEQNSYTCKAGQTFETVITAEGPINSSGNFVPSTVQSFSSSNTSLATIDTNTSYQLKCINCKVVRVVCKAAGSLKLKASSSTGATTSVNLKVTN